MVDQQQRREAIADAVLAVVARGGLEAASLRNVAEHAHLAIGSVRHYFDGHDDLIVFAVQELNRRLGLRVRSHTERILTSLLTAGSRDERRLLCEELLAEWLPLDETRYREAVLRHTFTVAARTRPQLRAHADALRAAMTTVVHRVLTEARNVGGLPADVDVDLETTRLCALLDGLSAQGVLSPAMSPQRLRDVLSRHLDSLQ